jgi:hypothetical protein
MKFNYLFYFLFFANFLNSQQINNEITQSKTPQGVLLNEKCGTTSVHNRLMNTDPQYVLNRQQIDLYQRQFSHNPVTNKVGTYVIPIVVHIIYTANGDLPGDPEYITDAQVQSAIDNLNDAYSNQAPYTGSDTEVQFCLAQRDESGNPTTGIIRVDGTGATGYSTYGISTGPTAGCPTCTDNEEEIKALSVWDHTLYYNFWIVSEIDGNNAGGGTQGYAYYPGAGPTVDGAVVMYNSFGYDPGQALGYNLKSYTDLNVTTIHEMGHALDVKHTFNGDGTGSTCPTNADCSTDGDEVCDTPPHKRSSSDCNTGGTNACDGGSSNSLFVHNFMDYSSDDCQTEFTAGQIARITATMTGARASLTTSNGCVPANNAYDASITTIIAPTASYCQTTFSPQVTLRNFGTTTLTDVTINYDIDGGANQTYAWSGSLTTGSSTNVTLNSVSTTVGAHTFNASTDNPNGNADEYTANDDESVAFTITASSALPFTEDFEGAFPPASWSINSVDTYSGAAWDADPSVRQWEKRAVTAESDGTAGNAAAMNCFAYGFNNGSLDDLISPSINLSSATNPILKFQVSYKPYGASNAETLKIYVSDDCGVTYTEEYNKTYLDLSIGGTSSASWAPTTSAHWREETIDLSAYAGKVVTIKFENTNDYGNNLYIDKINLEDCSTIVTQPSDALNVCNSYEKSFSVVVNDATSYQWQVSTDNGGSWNNVSGLNYTGGTSATLTIGILNQTLNNNQYKCLITGTCATNLESNPALLTIRPIVAVASGLNTTNITSSVATLNWNAEANISSVRIALRKVGTTLWHITDIPYATSYNRVSNFTTDADYEWKVRFENTNGCWGEWSNKETFYVCKFSTPPNSLSAAHKFANRVNLYWNHPGADEFRIALRKVGTTTWHYNDFSTSGVTYQWLSDFTPNSSYEWKIKARCENSWGDWSGLHTFTSGTVNGMIQQGENVFVENEIDFSEKMIEVYPNPNTGDFTISSTFEGTLKIVNELGQEIQSIIITKDNNFKTKIDNLPKGVYFVTGTIESDIITKKIIVLD